MSLIDPFVTWLATKFIFFPTRTIAFYPGQFELDYEEIHFDSENGIKLHGWFLPGGPPDRTVIYFHGNAGNIADRLPKLKRLHGIGMNIFAFDYRGYGLSDGEPSIEGVVADSRAAYHYVTSRKDVNRDRVILYGESLGGAMAIQVAEQEKYAGLILESTFTSVKDMARDAYPFMPDIMIPDIYRSIDIIPKLREPLLIIHGTEDNVVPFKFGKELHQAAAHPKRFVPIKGAAHSDVHEMVPNQYTEIIENFLVEIGE